MSKLQAHVVANTTTPAEGASRLLARWPNLPLLSLGFWIAWRFVMLSNTVPMSLNNGAPLFYAAMIIVCAFAAVKPGSFRAFTSKPAVIVTTSVLAAAATVLLVVPGGRFGTFSTTVEAACAIAGFAISGVCMTCIALHACELLGRLNPTNVWIWIAYTEFFVVGLYFIISSSPALVSLVGLALLPLAAGFLINLGNQPGSSLVLAQEERENAEVSTSSLIKLFLFILSFSLAACFAKMVTLWQIPEETSQGIIWPALERIGIAFAVIAAVVYFSKRLPFSKMCMFVVIMVVTLLGCFIVSFPDNVALFFVTTLAHSTLECIAIAFSACLIFKSKFDPYFIGGITLATLYGGSFVADLLKELFAAGNIDYSLFSTAFIAVTLLSILSALIFFRDTTFDTLLGSVEDFFPAPHTDDAVTQEGPSAKTIEKLCATYGLSPRERTVVEKLCSGNTVTRIADDLSLSVHTVRGYVQSIYTKCDVHSRDELLDLVSTSK